ncbi:hypothetical protein QUF61_11995 [Candidatus Venteria ishoeyi]|uniref:hypothetical protein n=1 Tax=Candidatus Venteria ishoeyi TaxID=1899563 RepID=UPI0025A5BA7C|nr:hypothetical protein [Candidatus Venteria ishoeyi]MDM8547208.1 hypothetical protein [Candidatus Venteria ishoeyi]
MTFISNKATLVYLILWAFLLQSIASACLSYQAVERFDSQHVHTPSQLLHDKNIDLQQATHEHECLDCGFCYASHLYGNLTASDLLLSIDSRTQQLMHYQPQLFSIVLAPPQRPPRVSKT